MCKNSTNLDLNTIDFGDPQKGDVCWNIGTDSHSFDNAENRNISESLTTLFNGMWKRGTENWNSISGGNWKALCTSSVNKKWTIIQPNEGEYLGYCGSFSRSREDIDKNVFIEKIKTAGDRISLKICFGTCFREKNEQIGGFKQWEEKTGEWADVKFRGSE